MTGPGEAALGGSYNPAAARGGGPGRMWFDSVNVASDGSVSRTQAMLAHAGDGMRIAPAGWHHHAAPLASAQAQQAMSGAPLSGAQGAERLLTVGGSMTAAGSVANTGVGTISHAPMHHGHINPLLTTDLDNAWMTYATEHYPCNPRSYHRSNVVWLLLSGFRVFTMQGGFALLESGVVRRNHVISVMLKNLGDVIFGGMAWWTLGYGIAFGNNGDVEQSVPAGMGFASGINLLFPPIWDHGFWFFQYSFAATSTTIVSGMIAERARLGFYLLTSFFITALVYPVVVHWVWGKGWLSQLGYVDFAGSSAVHMTGAFSGLAYVMVLGSRTGRWNPAKEIHLPPAAPGLPPIPYRYKYVSSSPVYVLFGTLLLWTGWYGFNPGSTLGSTGDYDIQAAAVAVNTTLAAIGGGITPFLWRVVVQRDESDLIVQDICLGTLTGLVSSCAGCFAYDEWAALLVCKNG